MKKKLFLGTFISIPIFLFAGCSFSKEQQTEESIQVEKDQAKHLEIDIELGLGEVTLSKGTEQWVEGVAKYSKEKLAPHVNYKLKREKGKLEIAQKSVTTKLMSNVKSLWTLQLNEQIPMDLTVETGAAVADLDLRGLQLDALAIQAGVGELTVNMGGDWSNSFDTKIETGVGETIIYLPSSVGVKVKVDKGIGTIDMEGLTSQGKDTYVNAAYGNSDVVINIDVEMGVGSLTFEVEE